MCFCHSGAELKTPRQGSVRALHPEGVTYDTAAGQRHVEANLIVLATGYRFSDPTFVFFFDFMQTFRIRKIGVFVLISCRLREFFTSNIYKIFFFMFFCLEE